MIATDFNPDKLIKLFEYYRPKNRLMDAYYEGERQVPTNRNTQLITSLRMVLGWPAICVDVLHERLDFLGWDDDGKIGMEDVYFENNFDYESSLAHVDALLYGLSFMALHTGAQDEPDALITAETPKRTAGVWNRRTRRLDVGITADERDAHSGELVSCVVFEPDQNVTYERKGPGSPWKVVEVDRHNLHRVPLVQLTNRGRAGRMGGKSEITRSIRTITDGGVRTLLGMEVNREFYSAPQRYVLGAKENAFTDANGNPIPGFRAIMGALWNLERDEEWAESHPNSDGLPTVGEFKANPPGPYLDQVKGLSMLVAAESGIPPSMFGFATDNPPSADSIRALEGRLIKRAERRQIEWNPAYREIATLVAKMNGKPVPKAKDLGLQWRDPSTPTKAADADRATKLVGAQVLPADSSVTWDMVGISRSDQRRLERDRNKAAFRQVLMGGVANGNGNPPAPGANQPANGNSPQQPVAPAGN